MKRLIYIVIAILIMSISVNMFLGPHHIAAGGITGLSIILEDLYGLNRSIVILITNIILLFVTYKLLGKEIFLNTFIGSMLLPLFINLIPKITLTNDIMLSMIIGSILFGIAVSILYHNNASSGGTSIPPLLFQKYYKLNTSVGLFLTDGIVVILCLLVFSFEIFLYAILSILITSITMNNIRTGLLKEEPPISNVIKKKKK